jgi:hypothetical protein
MPGTVPKPVWIYRLVHIDNLEYLLTNGVYTQNHPKADPNYINIGDTGLIAQRNNYPVKIAPPGGALGDYVPFYFAGHSPMLLNIKTGHRGITQRPQSELVYLCCRVDDIVANCAEWCFTDGHAKDSMTSFYNDLNDMNNVDWNAVVLQYWFPIQTFLDRQTKKQAEFLVKNEVPVKCISGLIVYDQNAHNIIHAILRKHNIQIKVHIDSKRKYFYP